MPPPLLSGRQVACIAAYGLSFFVFGLQVNLLGPTASVLAARLGVSEADLGLVFTLNGFASILGGLPAGWLVDRLPGHAVLACALSFQAVGFVVIPFARTFAGLVATFAVVALSWNIINTAGNTYVLWIGAASSSSRAQATLINAVNALFGAGSLAAPLLAELCRVRGVYPPPAGAGGASVDADVRQLDAYWLAAALTAVSACCFLVLPSPSPPGTTTSGSSSRCAADSAVVDDALTAESSSGDGALGTASSVTAAAVAAQTGASAGRWRTTLLCCIALFQYLNVGTEVAFGGWIYTYSVRQAGLGPATSHGINAAYWASFTGGRLVASAAAVKLSPAALLGASLPLAVVGAAAALLMPSGSLGAGGGLLYVISALVGLGAAPGFANALALLDSFLPASGTVTGMLSTVAGAGVMTVPLAVALLSQPRFGLQYRSLMVVSLLSFVGQLVLVPFALHAGRCLGVVGRLHTHTRGENDARRYQVQDEGLRASLLGGDGTTAECC